MFFARRLEAIVVFSILIMGFVPCVASPRDFTSESKRIRSEQAAMNKNEETIHRANEQVLQILQTENACSAWFNEADPEPAEVFRSLHYEVETDKSSNVSGMIDGLGGQSFKQPWAARSTENGGRNSVIELNLNGAFFRSISSVIMFNSNGGFLRWGGFQTLTVGSHRGDTIEVQITILLHELGHIIGRIPEDRDSWDGQSSRNTREVLRYCEGAIRESAPGSANK